MRLMTIHKSKGLEFPVVFLTGGSQRFNRRQDESRVILHRKYGIAADYIDFENSYRVETPAKSVISAEQTSEEIRKLYVALTRAKEKLYFVAAIPSSNDEDISAAEKYISQMRKKINQDKIIAPNTVLSSSSFADWIVPVATISDNWLLRTLCYDALTVSQSENPIYAASEGKDIDIDYILDFEYKFKDISAMPTKLSVSEIKSKNTVDINPMPEFLKGKRKSGAFYGTVMHTVLQHLVPIPNMDIEYINNSLKSMTLDGILTADETKLINPDKILKFYTSDIGKRIIRAKDVFREQSFEVLIPTKHLYPDLKCPESESILIQGVIDCWFYEDDEIVLVDYKTDAYTDISEIHNKYDVQLDLYKYALEKITKSKVKEKYIYLFFDNSKV